MTDIKQQGDLYIIDDDNNTLTVDSANTRVGIGNNNPGHSLSVTGDGNFTANLSAGSNLFLVDAGNSRITLGTTTAVSGNVLTVVGNTDIAGTTNTTTLQLGGVTLTATATELNQLSGITLGTAASDNTGDFATAAQGLLADSATQPGDNISTLTNDAGYTTNTGTVTSITASAPLTGGTITTSGSVGINQATTSTDGYLSSTDWNTFNNKQPAGAYLTVVATDGVTITGDGTLGNPLVASGGGGGGISIGDAVGSGTPGSILFVDGSTNLAQNNGELYWDNANNRLGIGTTSPSAAIEVDAGASTEYAILTTGANGRVGLTTQYGGIHFNNVEGTADLWQLSERDTAHFDMAFGTPDAANNVSATDTKLRITNSGNVGIGLGNTDPSTKLHVVGTIRQTNSTNAVLVSDGNGDIGSASNLQDVAYLQSVGAFVPPAAPPTPTGALPDSPLPFPVSPVGWVEVNIGGSPYYLPAYQ